ncbi:MAG: DnaD domain protein [Clostridiales bacterium]|nr:DnaD domain protein [Clostridiales bacterium]
MDYRFNPFGAVWNDGIFNVPVALVDNYLKIASEYQIKALLFILRNGGMASSAQIAKFLGQTVGDIDDLLEFWVEEGIISANGDTSVLTPANDNTDNLKEKEEGSKEKLKEVKAKDEKLSPPNLSPADIVAILRDDPGLRFLLSEAQIVLGRTISHAEQEMLINIVNYYGLKTEIVLMILEFYRAEKEKGKSIGISYIISMAKNWAEEGVDTITDAEEKLQSIAKSDRLWSEVVAITGIRHRRPTQKQREMVLQWFDDFDISMITLASDIMKENTSEPKLSYVNSILKKWKKNGITTPEMVKQEQKEFEQKKESGKSNKSQKANKLKSKPSYDLEKVKESAMNNTDI